MPSTSRSPQEPRTPQVVVRRADYERYRFLARDNGLLQREVETLRDQVAALRTRNKELEDDQSATEIVPDDSPSRRAASTSRRQSPPETPTRPPAITLVAAERPAQDVVLLADAPLIPDETPTAGSRRSPPSSMPIESSGTSPAEAARPLPAAPPPGAAAAAAGGTPGSRSRPISIVPQLPVRLPLVSQVPLPDIPQALAAAGLLNPSKQRVPGAVASFLSNTTSNFHEAQKTYRAAFEHAFRTLRGRAPGALAREWHDAHDECVFGMRPDEDSPLAWVLLLGLSLAVLGPAVVDRMRRLPLLIKLEMLPFIPPGSNPQAVMEFTTETIETVVDDLWSAKREILSLKHRWA